METSLRLYDLRKTWGEESPINLGEAHRLFLNKEGRLAIGTDLAFELRVDFSKDDLHLLLHRLIEIRKTELEQKAKRRAKAEAKATKAAEAVKAETLIRLPGTAEDRTGPFIPGV